MHYFLIISLYREANLRSRGKRFNASDYSTTTNQLISHNSKTNAVDGSYNKRTENSLDNSKVKQSSDAELCPLKCTVHHLFPECSVYQNLSVDEQWEFVKQNNRCRKCLMTHHTNLCKKPNRTTCKQCTKHHHYSLHNNRRNSDGNAHFNQQSDASKLEAGKINIETSSKPTIKTQNNNVQGYNKIKGVYLIQKVRVRNKNGEFVEILAIIDTDQMCKIHSKTAWFRRN